MSFRAALIAHGLRPRDIVADGRWYRCPTDDKPRSRNGAYVMRQDGVGFYMDWARDAEPIRFGDEVNARPIQIDHAAVARQRERARQERRQAIDQARARWDASRPMTRLHPYIENKGLTAQGCKQLRVQGDLLLVPMFWRDRLCSIQSIAIDGEKRFHTGCPTRGAAFVIERKRAAVTAFCEGLATGLAIFQSIRHARVVVAFNAGNLVTVVEQMRPKGNVVICADNDAETADRIGRNPGIDKAREAAELIGAGVAWPEGIRGTDWADALDEWTEGHRRIERLILKEARYVM